jgi:hypothetical protein
MDGHSRGLGAAAAAGRRKVLPPLLIGSGVVFLLAGELFSGTTLYFALMMALAVLFACVTYNILGGLGTISGIAFTRFALSTLVISQFGKALIFEKADANLDVPQLTITVYAVYYGCLMLGTFVFSRLRLPLPKPAEPETEAQSRYLYVASLIAGIAGTLGEWLVAPTSLTHGFARAFAYLLPFSLVLAVDNRIRSTGGQHSFGWKALWPTLGIMLPGLILSSRTGFVEPLAIIAVTCYLRGFKFRRRHVTVAIFAAVSFFFFVSPFLLYSRSTRDEATFGEVASAMIRSIEAAPSQWGVITSRVGEEALATPGTVNYFTSPGAVTLNRFALIGPDSTLINACSTGFHYGFTSIKLDILSELPRFLSPNKSEIGSKGYLGHLDGMESDVFETTNSAITPISDSYGAFSWIGVMVFPFLVMPVIFVVYESMFKMQTPWGTVATALLLFSLTEGSMGQKLTVSLIKDPAYVLILSWCAAWAVKLIPVTGDRAVTVRKDGHRPFAAGAIGD